MELEIQAKTQIDEGKNSEAESQEIGSRKESEAGGQSREVSQSQNGLYIDLN